MRISDWSSDVCSSDLIELEVGEGEMVGLIGASGSGKSTLIRLVCGLERMDRGAAGRIALFGQETQADGRFSAQAEARRGDVGVIFQQFNLVNRLSLDRKSTRLNCSH